MSLESLGEHRGMIGRRVKRPRRTRGETQAQEVVRRPPGRGERRNCVGWRGSLRRINRQCGRRRADNFIGIPVKMKFLRRPAGPKPAAQVGRVRERRQSRACALAPRRRRRGIDTTKRSRTMKSALGRWTERAAVAVERLHVQRHGADRDLGPNRRKRRPRLRRGERLLVAVFRLEGEPIRLRAGHCRDSEGRSIEKLDRPAVPKRRHAGLARAHWHSGLSQRLGGERCGRRSRRRRGSRNAGDRHAGHGRDKHHANSEAKRFHGEFSRWGATRAATSSTRARALS